jgi:hypothetical protein
MSLNKHGRDEIIKQAQGEGYSVNSTGRLQNGSKTLWFSETGQSVKTNSGDSYNSVCDFKNRKK